MTPKVFLIQSGGLGRGEDRLGVMLMANFLRLLGDSKEKPSTLVFWNIGVRLVCENSPVLDPLKRLEEQWIEIFTRLLNPSYLTITPAQ
jgi:hypothetical protein